MLHRWTVSSLLVLTTAVSTASAGDVYPDANWQTATPESVGMDSAKLQFALNKAFGHVVCIRSGYLVGVKGDPAKRYPTYSVGKSLTALVFGRLMQQGTLNYLNAVPGSNYPTSPLANYRQMMSMVSDYGLTPHHPNKHYAYNNKAVHHYGEAMRPYFGNASPVGVLDQALFNTIGRQDALTYQGLWSGWNGGFSMSGRDLARVGYLVLRRGKWKTTQLLPESFVDDLYANWIPPTAIQNTSTGPSSGPTEGPDGNNWWNQNHLSAVLPGNYSLGWWTNVSNRWPGLPKNSIYAEGLNDHRVFVSPEDDLVVVNMYGNGFWNPEEVFKPFVDAVVADPPPPTDEAEIGGEAKVGHELTLTFTGPMTSEQDAANPFLDYRLDVTFSKGAQTIVVPGYYAANGDAGQSGVDLGDKWRAHFVPPSTGEWTYLASFRSGPDVALDLNPGGGAPVGFDGATGKIAVAANDKPANDPRSKGRLTYVDERYLRYAESGEPFLKSGTTSPENFLAFADFDATAPTHAYSFHQGDWSAGDPEWGAGLGRGIIGALNYLAAQGVNSISFLVMNVQGDGGDVWPWTSATERYRFDCSKLDQWEIVFDHAQSLGIHLHLILQEGENHGLLDGGFLGIQRKVFYREMVARFSHHLALTWGLGEEMPAPISMTQLFANRIRTIDPWDHPISVHHAHHADLATLSGLLGHPTIEVASLNAAKAQVVGAEVEEWVEASAQSGREWIVGADEFGPQTEGVLPDGVDPAHDLPRTEALWPALLAGAAGVEWYFGYGYIHNDLTCENFRSREKMFQQTALALDFWRDEVDFEALEVANERVSVPGRENGRASVAFGDEDELETVVIQLPTGGAPSFDFGDDPGVFTVAWFDPRNGGVLQTGSVTDVIGPGIRPLGVAPAASNQDWIVLVERADKWLHFYGQGVAGQGGTVPVVSGSEPKLGSSEFAVALSSARPNSMAAIVIGDKAISMPLFGGTLLANPWIGWVLHSTDANGQATQPLPLPLDSSLAGSQVYFQWLVADAAAPQGAAFTRGMRADLH
ncbi:MAG: DUF5060 domain-containing protein [Planctomycetota bacterium JB042]